jgi:DNA-directed RNA polymerase specialized sigma24 family protein
MTAPGSVTQWVERLKGGDGEAAQKLWEWYAHQLMALARQELRAAPRRLADEEDVALSAFDSFCRRAERGQFPQLRDRDNLWALLTVLTARKAVNLVRREARQKRGGPQADEALDVEQLFSREPSPEVAAQVVEECQRLLARLDDASLRSVALWKMEGYTNDEIAAKLGCVGRTVERKLRLIRDLWREEEPTA